MPKREGAGALTQKVTQHMKMQEIEKVEELPNCRIVQHITTYCPLKDVFLCTNFQLRQRKVFVVSAKICPLQRGFIMRILYEERRREFTMQ